MNKDGQKLNNEEEKILSFGRETFSACRPDVDILKKIISSISEDNVTNFNSFRYNNKEKRWAGRAPIVSPFFVFWEHMSKLTKIVSGTALLSVVLIVGLYLGSYKAEKIGGDLPSQDILIVGDQSVDLNSLTEDISVEEFYSEEASFDDEDILLDLIKIEEYEI